MIIEGSFFKLPELLMSASFDFDGAVEATVRHLFATAVLMELIGRGTPRPQEHVTSEKLYPEAPPGTIARCDLLVDLQRARGRRMEEYGTCERNWIEIKTCLGGRYSRTQRVGGILKDLLRICLFPDELRGSIRQNGRYFLLVADEPFEKSLPKFEEKQWLSDLLRSGSREVCLDLSGEAGSIQQAVSPRANSFHAKLNVTVETFAPKRLRSRPLFWGALVRIGSFNLRTTGSAVNLDELGGWSVDDENQIAVARRDFGSLDGQTAADSPVAE